MGQTRVWALLFLLSILSTVADLAVAGGAYPTVCAAALGSSAGRVAFIETALAENAQMIIMPTGIAGPYGARHAVLAKVIRKISPRRFEVLTETGTKGVVSSKLLRAFRSRAAGGRALAQIIDLFRFGGEGGLFAVNLPDELRQFFGTDPSGVSFHVHVTGMAVDQHGPRIGSAIKTQQLRTLLVHDPVAKQLFNSARSQHVGTIFSPLRKVLAVAVERRRDDIFQSSNVSIDAVIPTVLEYLFPEQTKTQQSWLVAGGYTSRFDLEHELVHLRDFADPAFQGLDALLKDLEEAKIISGVEAGELRELILEQRAYATVVRNAQDLKQTETQSILASRREKSGAPRYPLSYYSARHMLHRETSEAIDGVANQHGRVALAVLKRLKSQHPEAYAELRGHFRRLEFKSKQLGLSDFINGSLGPVLPEIDAIKRREFLLKDIPSVPRLRVGFVLVPYGDAGPWGSFVAVLGRVIGRTSGNQYLVETELGETVSMDRKSLEVFNRFSVMADNVRALREFYLAGGEGEIFVVKAQALAGAHAIRENSLAPLVMVRRMPSHRPLDDDSKNLFIADEVAIARATQLLKQGKVFVYAALTHSEAVGGVQSREDPLKGIDLSDDETGDELFDETIAAIDFFFPEKRRVQNWIELTPLSGRYLIEHEMVHFNDFESGRLNDFAQKLVKWVQDHKDHKDHKDQKLLEGQAEDIWEYIVEQRAYASESEARRLDVGVVNEIPALQMPELGFYTFPISMKPFAEYASQDDRLAVISFVDSYVARVVDTLEDIWSRDKTLFAEIADELRKYSVPSRRREFDVDTVINAVTVVNAAQTPLRPSSERLQPEISSDLPETSDPSSGTQTP